jgi:flagellar basal-body rod protein FlgF
MQSSLSVGLSAQIALQNRRDTVANNIANMQTPGFRGDAIDFHALVASAGGQQIAFADAGHSYISTAPGEMTRTGNPLDIAIQGGGWLALSTPQGVAFTRDGRMQMDANGNLRSVNGYPLLDAGKAPITVDPSAGPISVAQDGMITQAGQQIGAIGLFRLPPSAQLSRFDNSAVRANVAAEPILDFTGNGVVQGFLEKSNVDPAQQLVQLMEVSRAFESVSNVDQDTANSLKDAIKTLG